MRGVEENEEKKGEERKGDEMRRGEERIQRRGDRGEAVSGP